jgi:hypothetical protein
VSTLRESVLGALSDEPQTRGEIVGAVGLEDKQVANVLNQLKNAGSAKREKDGWIRVAGKAQPKAAEYKGNGDTPPPKRAYKRRAPAPITAKGNSVASQVDFTYFGEFVVLRRKDVAELLAVIERWRGVIEAA